jgi:hypothetical protein
MVSPLARATTPGKGMLEALQLPQLACYDELVKIRTGINQSLIANV